MKQIAMCWCTFKLIAGKAYHMLLLNLPHNKLSKIAEHVDILHCESAWLAMQTTPARSTQQKPLIVTMCVTTKTIMATASILVATLVITLATMNITIKAILVTTTITIIITVALITVIIQIQQI